MPSTRRFPRKCSIPGRSCSPQGTGPGQYNYPAGNGFSAGQQHVGPYGSVNALATACYGNTIKDAGTVAPGAVAIVPFQWVVGNMNGVNGTAGTATKYGDGSSFTVPTNITQQVANQLIGVGAVPQALFTGLSNEADFGNWFMFLGRNEDSGTRILYLMESQFGVTTAPDFSGLLRIRLLAARPRPKRPSTTRSLRSTPSR